MPYTTHGHWYGPGHPAGPGPAAVARCGGPGICPQCSQEASRQSTEDVIERHDPPSDYICRDEWRADTAVCICQLPDGHGEDWHECRCGKTWQEVSDV
jgi:hypothetical protein